MSLRKTGSGQIIGEDEQPTQKIASKPWSEQDSKELAEEMTESEKKASPR